MKNAKIFISIMLASILILTQFAVVLAAPPVMKATPIAGKVNSVSLSTDLTTGVVTVLVEITDLNGKIQTVRISEKTAAKLGLIDHDSADGNPFIVNTFPAYIEIEANNILTDQRPRNPIGSTLADYFDDIDGVDYDLIMEAHANGSGFGVIAQALWLIEKMGGTADEFLLLLEAKKNNDFTDFPLDNETIPSSWGELRKAILDKHLGLIMSQKNKDDQGGGHDNPNEPTVSNDTNTSKSDNGNKNNEKSNNGVNSGQEKGNGYQNEKINGKKP